ncbi:unnamed protein product [Musa hybrid cultivar]
MSLKAVRVQRPREPQCPREAPAVKACEEQEKEWVAEPESGVLITLVSLPDGGNNIKKIRFSQKMFDDLGAQRWWSENYDKIMELYSIGPGHSSPTPPPSENEVSLASADSSFDVTEKTTRWHHEVKHKLKSFASSRMVSRPLTRLELKNPLCHCAPPGALRPVPPTLKSWRRLRPPWRSKTRCWSGSWKMSPASSSPCVRRRAAPGRYCESNSDARDSAR